MIEMDAIQKRIIEEVADLHILLQLLLSMKMKVVFCQIWNCCCLI